MSDLILQELDWRPITELQDVSFEEFKGLEDKYKDLKFLISLEEDPYRESDVYFFKNVTFLNCNTEEYFKERRQRGYSNSYFVRPDSSSASGYKTVDLHNVAHYAIFREGMNKKSTIGSLEEKVTYILNKSQGMTKGIWNVHSEGYQIDTSEIYVNDNDEASYVDIELMDKVPLMIELLDAQQKRIKELGGQQK